MADVVAGFPFWPLRFDKDGNGDATVDTFLDELPGAGLTDLFIFSHGWNNDETTALDLYSRFFGAVRDVLSSGSATLRAGAKIGVAGVLWPSILFPGDTVPPAAEGGASSFTNSYAGTLETELPKVFCQPGQFPLLQDLLNLLKTQPPSNDALFEFRDKLTHMLTMPQNTSTQDSFEALTATSSDRWLELLDAAAEPPTDNQGGAADFGGFFDKLWSGAKSMLRVATYWEMKNRAGVIGQGSLGPLIGRAAAGSPALKFYLLGHSFGARLVSYSLKGLPDATTTSPVKMLYLLQGAFSHFAFAAKLPFDTSRSGDLAGMSARVDGPLLTTFSAKDTAVGVSYPAASLLAGQDAADTNNLMYRWQGMGCDGAQGVDAASGTLGSAPYTFERGRWLNLDGNTVIVAGGPPSGAHSDIVHQETAFVALAGAALI